MGRIGQRDRYCNRPCFGNLHFRMRVTGVHEKAPLDDVESGDGKTNLQILEGWIAADPISKGFREPWTAVLGKGPFEKRVQRNKGPVLRHRECPARAMHVDP